VIGWTRGTHIFDLGNLPTLPAGPAQGRGAGHTVLDTIGDRVLPQGRRLMGARIAVLLCALLAGACASFTPGKSPLARYDRIRATASIA
jgi:hypothetical protein